MSQNSINAQGLATVTALADDEVVIYDDSDSGNPKKSTAQDIANLAPGSFSNGNEVTGTTQAMAVNTGYIANNASLVTLTLPSTAAIGSIFRVTGKGAGLFKIAQNASQTVNFSGVATTTGSGGSITALDQFDSITIECITADNDFAVNASVGNFTIA